MHETENLPSLYWGDGVYLLQTMDDRMRSKISTQHAAKIAPTSIRITPEERARYQRFARRDEETPRQWAQRVLGAIDEGNIVLEEDVLCALRITGDI